MNTDIRMSADYQRAVSDFVRRNVVHCVSHLVSEVSQNYEHFRDYEDELLDAVLPVPDYEEAAYAAGWRSLDDGPCNFYVEEEDRYYLSVNLDERGLRAVSVHLQSEPGEGSNGAVVWSFHGDLAESNDLDGSERLDITDPDSLFEYLTEQDVLPVTATLSTDADDWGETSDADDWHDLCDEQSIDDDDYAREVFEHWIVDPWFAARLREHGEKVIDDYLGLTVWCRTTTGQAISIDCVVCDIYDENQ